eukprot:COSAG02_NODE_29743_length_564_cov_0.548387_1_plen_68_part_10
MAFTHTTILAVGTVDLTKLLIDNGVTDCICAAMKAFELHGSSAIPTANVCLFVHLFLVLRPLDLTAAE